MNYEHREMALERCQAIEKWAQQNTTPGQFSDKLRCFGELCRTDLPAALRHIEALDQKLFVIGTALQAAARTTKRPVKYWIEQALFDINLTEKQLTKGVMLG